MRSGDREERIQCNIRFDWFQMGDFIEYTLPVLGVSVKQSFVVSNLCANGETAQCSMCEQANDEFAEMRSKCDYKRRHTHTLARLLHQVPTAKA